MENKLQISFGFCVFQVLGMLLLPVQWWFGAFLAALIHESFHVCMILLCKGKILSVTLQAAGAIIETLPMSSWKQALCALAGPLGSFLCLRGSEYFPELALCGLIQGIYNLLPIYPLDGGRILRYISSTPVSMGLECFTMTFLSGISLWLAEYCAEASVILLISLWYPMIQRKKSCKEGNLAVQ